MMPRVRWRFDGLFWRMAASYVAVSVVVTVITYFASRYEGPFTFLRDSEWVHFFNHLFDNQTNSPLLLLTVISGIGAFPGAVSPANPRGPLRRLPRAAEAWRP